MLEIITNSDAKIVCMNGMKAGVQVWPNKIKHRRSNVKPPSELGYRMRMKCTASGYDFEREVDNGLLLTETLMLHQTGTGHQGWAYEHLE